MDERFASTPVHDAKIRVFEPQEVLNPTVVLGTIKLGLNGYAVQRRVVLTTPLFVAAMDTAEAQEMMADMGAVLQQASQIYVYIHGELAVDATIQGEIYCDGEPLGRAVAMRRARQAGELAL